MKRVMILREHHGKRYLDVSTDKQLLEAALSVIKGRFSGENEYYPLDWMEDNSPPSLPEITLDEYNKMPEGKLKKTAKEILDSYEQSLKVYHENQLDAEAIKRCIETNDGRLAFKIMKKHQGYADESFEIVEIDDVY